MPVNCAAVPEHRPESELFGYERGAFTGSRRKGKPGLFESAGEGTLFLDEIAEMPPASQAKILRAIQEKRVRRIGGDKEISIDTRIITATNRNLERLVDARRFRKDLYFRINVLPIHIPPLAERIGDILALTDHFLFNLSTKLGRKQQSVSPEAMEKMKRYDWPGNVRELKHVVERAFILCEEQTIGEEAILLGPETAKPGSAGIATGAAGEVPMAGGDLKTAVAAFEKRIIAGALKTNPSIRAASRQLGISHPALINKMKKYGLKMVKLITDGKPVE
jgi:transcriptional regulator of aroF, aroG, tyrA and aromatic amino acid transport